MLQGTAGNAMWSRSNKLLLVDDASTKRVSGKCYVKQELSIVTGRRRKYQKSPSSEVPEIWCETRLTLTISIPIKFNQSSRYHGIKSKSLNPKIKSTLQSHFYNIFQINSIINPLFIETLLSCSLNSIISINNFFYFYCYHPSFLTIVGKNVWR